MTSFMLGCLVTEKKKQSEVVWSLEGQIVDAMQGFTKPKLLWRKCLVQCFDRILHSAEQWINKVTAMNSSWTSRLSYLILVSEQEVLIYNGNFEGIHVLDWLTFHLKKGWKLNKLNKKWTKKITFAHHDFNLILKYFALPCTTVYTSWLSLPTVHNKQPT